MGDFVSSQVYSTVYDCKQNLSRRLGPSKHVNGRSPKTEATCKANGRRRWNRIYSWWYIDYVKSKIAEFFGNLNALFEHPPPQAPQTNLPRQPEHLHHSLGLLLRLVAVHSSLGLVRYRHRLVLLGLWEPQTFERALLSLSA